MALFFISDGKTRKIIPTKVDLERSVQRLFEHNLPTIFDVTFLASEYSTSFGGRIDTLGIDKNGAPVIVEYKRAQNDSVINQGLSYLRWLLDHKAEFEVLVHNANLLTEIDWASPRVICVAERYNKFDLDTADLLPMNIELYRYQVYEDNILHVEAEQSQKVWVSTSKIFNKKEHHGSNDLKEKTNHNVADHLSLATPPIQELFAVLKERIIALDDKIIEESKAKYIAYKLTTNFVDIVLLKDSLKIFLNIPSSKLNDPQQLARDLTKPQKIGHWGNGDYELKLSDQKNLDAVMALVQQSYEYNK